MAHFTYHLDNDITVNGTLYGFTARFDMRGELWYDRDFQANDWSYVIDGLDSCTVTVYDAATHTEVMHDLLALESTDRALYEQLHTMLMQLVDVDDVFEALQSGCGF